MNATYLELANLTADTAFLGRVGYAINKFAAYIMHEDPGTANHAARRSWAIKSQSTQQTFALLPSILQDSNVLADAGSVSDTNLQTATEAAANEIISAAVSYMDLSNLAMDSGFQRRMQIAVAYFAAYILNESPSTANHPARYAWAKAAIMNSQGVANGLAPAVVMDSVVGTSLFATTDAQLQLAVEFSAEQLLL